MEPLTKMSNADLVKKLDDVAKFLRNQSRHVAARWIEEAMLRLESKE